MSYVELAAGSPSWPCQDHSFQWQAGLPSWPTCISCFTRSLKSKVNLFFLLITSCSFGRPFSSCSSSLIFRLLWVFVFVCRMIISEIQKPAYAYALCALPFRRRSNLSQMSSKVWTPDSKNTLPQPPLYNLFFSPTHSTRKIDQKISKEYTKESIETRFAVFLFKG